MKITTGRWRGQNLAVPDTAETRPTMDRTRQAIFNILRSASWALRDDGTPILNDAFVLDVFAGSGAMGFEALSQGGAHCIFFEQSAVALDAIKRNIEKFKCQTSVQVIKGDVMHARVNIGPPAQLAFLDPPYNEDFIAPALQFLQEKGWLDANTLLVLESHRSENIAGNGIEVLDERLYGLSKVTFARRCEVL